MKKINGNEIIEYIQKDDFLREIPVQNINYNQFIPVFILCQNSIVNDPNIDIIKLVKKQLSSNEIALINSSSLQLNFTPKEINFLYLRKSLILLLMLHFLKK